METYPAKFCMILQHVGTATHPNEVLNSSYVCWLRKSLRMALATLYLEKVNLERVMTAAQVAERSLGALRKLKHKSKLESNYDSSSASES